MRLYECLRPKQCLFSVTMSTFRPEGPQSTLRSSASNWLRLMIGNWTTGSENLLSSWNSTWMQNGVIQDTGLATAQRCSNLWVSGRTPI